MRLRSIGIFSLGLFSFLLFVITTLMTACGPGSSPSTPFGLVPTNTPVPTVNLSISSGVTLLPSGTYNFDTVNISGSAVVTLGGPVTIFAKSFSLGAGATIRGLGYWDFSTNNQTLPSWDSAFCDTNGFPYPSGYSTGYFAAGPGRGILNNSGGGGGGQDYTSGGGGHGGAGGSGYNPACQIAAGGVTNDDPVHPVLMGSGGGNPAFWGGGPPTSWGGGLIWIIGYDPTANKVVPVTINGTIDMDGFDGCLACGPIYEGGAGGAGGSILVEGSAIVGAGLLTANGGNGQNGLGPDGEGGGGIISIIDNSLSFSGTASVMAGGGGASFSGCSVSSGGASGSVTFTVAPGSGY